MKLFITQHLGTCIFTWIENLIVIICCKLLFVFILCFVTVHCLLIYDLFDYISYFWRAHLYAKGLTFIRLTNFISSNTSYYVLLFGIKIDGLTIIF